GSGPRPPRSAGESPVPAWAFPPAGRPRSGMESPEAPSGSGFEPAAITNQQAALYIRAMIGAAAADGRISSDEQQKILGSLNQVGLDSGAEEFLASELNNPSSAATLADAVGNEHEAVQVYTAARFAIDPDTRGEQAFLYELAQRLRIPDELRAHIDAATISAAA
ncbi:MAG: tellurite resistance TerB family protein, partial [Hyphomicrobiaceae bacterium]